MTRRLIIFCLLLALAAAAAAGAWYWRESAREQALRQALTRAITQEMTVRVPRGSSLAQIARDAAAAGAPVSPAEFAALAKRQGVAKSLQAGVYRFAAGQSVGDMLRDMAAGKVAVEKITFIEGRTFADLRAQLAADKRLRQRLPAMSDDDIRRALDISEAHLEGLFLPETYFFNDGDSDISVLRRAHRRLRETLAQAWAARQDGGVYKTPYEALILASIIEKETGKGEERPLIASVFVNRLRAGMRLQADPTVIYGLGDAFQGNLTRAHLRQDTPYNTYVRGGLTPTPIALAGAAAIRAALMPAETDYYYFVAVGDGSHYFSKNLRQHINAVNRYQKKRRKSRS